MGSSGSAARYTNAKVLLITNAIIALNGDEMSDNDEHLATAIYHLTDVCVHLQQQLDELRAMIERSGGDGQQR